MYLKVISMLDDFNDCVYSVGVRGDIVNTNDIKSNCL